MIIRLIHDKESNKMINIGILTKNKSLYKGLLMAIEDNLIS